MKKRLLILTLSMFTFFNLTAQVTADFSANTTSGCPNPLLVIVSDMSSTGSGSIDGWSWTLTGPAGFTTVNSSTNQISASLDIPGFYTVTLTACSGGVCDTKTEANYIEIFENPSFTYNITPLQGCAPQEVCFDGTINAGCGTVSSLVFDVNDGVIYSTEDFCHTYSNTGSYTDFVFSVQNSCGCVVTETIQDTIVVVDNPIASFTENQSFSCTSPLNVNFTNTSTASSNASYLWNIPGLVTNNSSTNISQTFGVGNYDVELIVTEPEGCSDTLLQTNHISVGNPIANFTSNGTSVCPGGSIQFTDLSNGTPTGWLWQVIGGASSSSQNPNLSFSTTGVFDVQLTTSYSGGCQDTELKIGYVTVLNAPTNNFTVTDSGSCLLPLSTAFTSTSTNSVATSWVFPGGTPSNANGNGPINVNYNSYGNYNILMYDTSANGCVSQQSFSAISLSPFTASIVADTINGCVPIVSNLSVQFNGVDSVSSYSWTLPGSDILNSSVSEPSPSYNASGCYDVTVDLISEEGCSLNLMNTNLICVGSPPIANFDFTPLNTCFEVDDICFTFTGSGADTILWNFDDGPTLWASPGTSPCHAYNTDIGNYSPSIIAFDNGCPSDTVIFLDSIEILGPISSFTADIKSCDEWNIFEMVNSSADADSSYWIFGDPSVPAGTDTSTLENPSWTYPTYDTLTEYTITHFAYNDSNNCEHQSSQTIQVYENIADFTYSDSIGCSPFTVTFTNTSNIITPSIWATRWNWDSTYRFDVGPVTTVWNNGIVRNRTYNTPGVYDVIMRNQDPRGCRDVILRNDLIKVHGSVIGFTSNVDEGCYPLSVNFTDTSFAPLSYIESWHWDFGTGDPSDTSNIQNPSFTYDLPGNYTITLSATDSFGCVSSKTFNNYIYVHNPLASFSLSDNYICNNQTVSINNLSSGDMLTYDWQFQNANLANYTTDGNPPNITFTTEGNNNIYLEVTDNFNCTDDTTIVLPVFDIVVDGTASNNLSFCPSPPLLVQFTNNSINNVDTNTILWDFGNGNTSTLSNPTQLYSTPGEFIVTLTANSFSGCLDTVTIDTIVIEGPWGEFELIDSANVCDCDTVTFAIKTLNANTPTFLAGDGQAIPFTPSGFIGDTILDTISFEYCVLGDYAPSLAFSEGACSYSITAGPNDTIRVDTLITHFNFPDQIFCDTGTVCFTDSTYKELAGFNDIDFWNWDFGDGNTSNLQNPCHFYNAPGEYQVCLDAGNLNACSKVYCDTVVIRNAPQVNFGLSDTSICVNNQVLFYDSTSLVPGATISNWHWDFGTGNLPDTSNIQNPSFTYSTGGNLTVNLVVEDNFGCESQDTSNIIVYNLPIVSAGNDTFVCLGDSVQINATGANVYAWTNMYNITDSSTSNPLVYPLVDTSYFVSGIDNNGCSNVDTIQVSVSSLQANFTNSLACTGDTVFFTNTSTSSLGIQNSWSWNFDDLASGANNTSSLENPNHTFNNPGNYDVSLIIQNTEACTDDTTIQVSVSVSPTAIIQFDSACANTEINFSSLLSLNGSGTIINRHWDFGTGNVADTSNVAQPNFTYTNPGLYTVCLTVVSDLACAGNTDDTCVQVLIYALPQAIETIDTVCLGAENEFDETSIAGDGNIIGHFWNFGQNPLDTAIIFSNNGDVDFQYNTFGTYNITHIVADDLGCVDTSFNQAVVYDNPSASFSFSTACLSQNNIFTSTSIDGLDGVNSINDYDWNFDEGASYINGASVENYSFNNIGAHNISLAISDNFGCLDTVTQLVNILTNPIANFTVSSNEICEGNQLILDGSSATFATPGVQYYWDENYNTGIDNNMVNYSFSPNSDAQIMFVVEDDNNCSDTAFTNIEVNQNPNASFAFGNGCVNLPIDLNSTSTEGDTTLSTFSWLINGSPSVFGANTTFTTNNASNVTAQLIVEDLNGCIDTSAISNVGVDTTVFIDLNLNDTIICQPGDLLLEASGTANSYEWSPQNIVDNPNSDMVTASVNNSVSIIVTGSSANNLCPQASDSMDVVLVTAPSVEYDVEVNPVFIGLSTDVSLNVIPFNNGTDSIYWNDNSTLLVNSELSVEATPTENTDYPFSVFYFFNGVTCQLDSFVNIQVLDECSEELIYAPNVFTPNNDQQNDIFRITGISLDYLTYLRVFDRWGKLVFEQENIEFRNGTMRREDAWDGNNLNGNYLNNGVYVIMYEGVCLNGESVVGSGNVTIVR